MQQETAQPGRFPPRPIARGAHARSTNVNSAAAAVEVLPLFEAEAKERMRACLRRGDIAPAGETLHERGRSDEAAGTALGVSGRSVAKAKKVAAEAPEVFDEVKAGRLVQGRAGARRRRALPAKPHDAHVCACA